MTKGFFKKDKIKTQEKKEKKKKDPCEICGLYKSCNSPKLKVYGEGRKKILLIETSPTKNEDEIGSYKITNILRNIFKEFDCDIKQDCWKITSVLCHIPKNRAPKTKEINNCHENIHNIIKKLKPKKIIIFGKYAMQSFLYKRNSSTGIEKWVGWQIPDQEYKAWVFPIWNPNILLIEKNKNNFALINMYKKYIENALTFDKELPDYSNIENEITILNDQKLIIDYLKDINDNYSIIAFDYETTGIKPHKDGHEIICCSIATKDFTISFPLSEKVNIFFKKILINEKIKKIAHNLRFENSWTKEVLNVDINNWYWDTMLGTHIIDNRSGICSLKFQGYVNFGIIGYEKEIEKFLDSKSKNCNDFNNIKDAPIDKVLLYCGIDSNITFKLYRKQRKYLKNSYAFNFFTDGIQAFCDVENNGINIDIDLGKKNNVYLQKRINRMYENLQQSKEVKKWQEKFQHEKALNFNSPKQIKEVFYDTLNLKIIKKTDKGSPSTDAEVLENFNTQFTKNIIKYKKYKKIKDTNLIGFTRETINGIMHPNFNLHTVCTYRSSSSNPNFQNVPIHDEFANKMIRPLIIPTKGNILLEVDYSSIEVCIAACYNKDKNMINYILDPTTDMHRDQACEIFNLKEDEITKELRQIVKNNFVFPQFYGDYYVNCATNIWNKIDNEIKQYLKKYGIIKYNDFEEHMKIIEHNFWNKRFPAYAKWKEKQWRDYNKNGYIDTHLGFRYSGIMNRKDVTNYPIQGTAFHCLLWSLIEINKFLKKNKCNTKIIGQIHDSIVFDMDLKEFDDLKIVIRNIMCNNIRKEWKWLIVPLDIKAEKTEVDGSWYTKKEIEF